jgi:hypothetical protein
MSGRIAWLQLALEKEEEERNKSKLTEKQLREAIRLGTHNWPRRRLCSN